MRVADLGCGRTGHFVFPVSHLVEDTGVVYAVDVMKDILESIKSRVRSGGYGNVQTIWSDVELLGKTPIPSESLDVCFITNVLFQVKDKNSTLSEAVRLLKKGGKLVVVDWAKNLGPLGPQAEKKVPVETVIDLGLKAGLQKFDSFPAGDYHYCLVMIK